MNSLKNIFLVLILAITAFSCAEKGVEDSIREAEMAVAQGDMISACSIADKITQDKNLSGLSPSQIGRLSILYMQIADSYNMEENTGKATDLFLKAFEVQPDSADAFFKSVDRDKMPYVSTLSELVSVMNYKADIIDHPEEEEHHDYTENQ